MFSGSTSTCAQLSFQIQTVDGAEVFPRQNTPYGWKKETQETLCRKEAQNSKSYPVFTIEFQTT